uniref:Uncharacterized protein n=1 Tax=Trichuris muris TaxID=70415 RepID=A0A5S6QLK6_TRIMR
MFGRFASWKGPPLLSVRHSTFRANGHSAQVLSIRGPQSSVSAILYVWEGSGRMVISHASRVHVRNSQRLATVRRSYFEGSECGKAGQGRRNERLPTPVDKGP